MRAATARALRVAAVVAAFTAAAGGGCACRGAPAASSRPAVPVTAPDAPRQTNRLARETSPYLLQHAHNPVDWFPWGDEAFAKAKAEGKPVFLSIGYSTCHWCHVMERESFEDGDIAAYLNAHFVPIKVDREERPDVDHIYMTVTQAMTGSGGWPMSVFLTPERTPFFAGTYFPPQDRHGRPGFPTLLRAIAQSWASKRAEIEAQGAHVVATLFADAGAAPPATAGAPGVEPLAATARMLLRALDPVRGGFGSAPKFPTPHQLLFLLREHRRTGDAALLRAVETTLDGMAAGGIHDHVGGGFHRYSTDPEWFLPHFEKMLYDQALLLRAYVEAYQVTGAARHAEVARGIVTYVLRDLRDAGGAFHSAEDADSEGDEGKFYVWTKDELLAVCGAADGALVCAAYGAGAQGNWEEEASGHRAGTNILHRGESAAATAAAHGFDVATLEARLAGARARLLAVRAKRVRPLRDDKVITEWNGLFIGALAKASRALGEPAWAQAAAEAATFLLRTHRVDGRWRRTSRGGTVGPAPAYVADTAAMAEGLLDLYEATGEARWLGEAAACARETVARFGRPGGGTLYFMAADGEALIARPTETYDGATPSGNSIAALACARLGRLLDDRALTDAAEAIVRGSAAELAERPIAQTYLLLALDFLRGKAREVVLAGEPATPAFAALRAELDRRFLPDTVCAVHPVGAGAAEIERLVPWLAGQGPVGGRAAAYVCQDHACQAPVTDPAALGALLERR